MMLPVFVGPTWVLGGGSRKSPLEAVAEPREGDGGLTQGGERVRVWMFFGADELMNRGGENEWRQG